MYPSSQAQKSPVLPTLFSISSQETHWGHSSPSGLWRLWACWVARSTPPVGRRTPQAPAGPTHTPTTHSPTVRSSWPSSSAMVWCVWQCWRNGLCRPPPTTWWWAWLWQTCWWPPWWCPGWCTWRWVSPSCRLPVWPYLSLSSLSSWPSELKMLPATIWD